MLLRIGLPGTFVPVLKSMIETLLLPLFATTARLRTLSTATPVGEVPTGIEATQTPGKVAGAGLQMAGAGDVRAISVMSLEPRFATTAIPVAVLIATAPGCMPAFSVATGAEGMFPGEGCTAKILKGCGVGFAGVPLWLCTVIGTPADGVAVASTLSGRRIRSSEPLTAVIRDVSTRAPLKKTLVVEMKFVPAR